MKFISLILAVYVLLLSAVPSFIEDKCMQEHTTEQGQNEQDEDCSCCSPFFSCNTCTGFVITTFHFSIIHTIKQPKKKLGIITVIPVSDFPFSVWHPPQLA
ncbi:hypothetical protein ACI75Y_12865 [Capnocytophaga stomatis]|uniref:Uncharacterized protein n=1 Tax=Capnocytophaga stomatis TaxID=1848904 RepID=A0A250FYF7_9FLAO|nr:hypothetical protein CGC58_10040 [Capnocytophaga stomatis]